MGCGHSSLQIYDPGPGIYSYSSGHRWQAANDNYYTTVMSYGSGGYYPDGNSSIGVSYFSNPNVQYNDVTTGDADVADNARTIRETKLKIAAFRTTPTTGITELKNVEIFTLYPNPTSELLNIQSKTISVNNSQKITINLIDYLGKKHELKIINQNAEIIQVNVGNQNTGIYFLQIMIDNELTKTLKVIIKD